MDMKLEVGAASIPRLTERSQWSTHHKRMVNVAKKYGKVAQTLVEEKEPTFEVLPGTASKGSFEQLLEVEKAKLVLKEEADFKENKIRFTSLIIDCLGTSMEAAIRSEEFFVEWYQENNFLKIWIKLKDLCVKSIMLDVDEKKYALWRVTQGTKSLDEYVIEVEDMVKVLEDNECHIEEEDVILIFMMGLEKRYGELVAEIRATRGTASYPDTFVKVKEMVKVWSNLRGLDNVRKTFGDGLGNQILFTKLQLEKRSVK
jgi:hypothetical protein